MCLVRGWSVGSALLFLAYAGVHQADWSLVSDEHWLLPLHTGPVLPGQWGGPEGESQRPPPRPMGLCCSWCAYGPSSDVCSSGSAVLPGGSNRGGEGGVSDQTDGQRGGRGCSQQPQIAVLQQGAHTHSQELPLLKPRVAAAGNKLWIQSGAAITGGRWFARARDPVSFSGYNGGRE